jgi:hypothetical protein
MPFVPAPPTRVPTALSPQLTFGPTRLALQVNCPAAAIALLSSSLFSRSLHGGAIGSGCSNSSVASLSLGFSGPSATRAAELITRRPGCQPRPSPRPPPPSWLLQRSRLWRPRVSYSPTCTPHARYRSTLSLSTWHNRQVFKPP